MDIDDQIRAKKESLGRSGFGNKPDPLDDFMRQMLKVKPDMAFNERIDLNFELGKATMGKTFLDLGRAGTMDDPLSFCIGCVKGIDIVLTMLEEKHQDSKKMMILLGAVRESISDLIRTSHSKDFVSKLD